MSILDFILALVLISFIIVLVNYVLGLLSVIPTVIVGFLTVGFLIAMLKFVIGR